MFNKRIAQHNTFATFKGNRFNYTNGTAHFNGFTKHG